MTRHKASLVILLFISATALAQGKKNFDFKKNNIKLNVLALPIKMISLQYERGLTEDISASLGFRFQLKSSIPFRSSFTKNSDPIEDSSYITFMNTAKLSGWAIAPEFRYYFGKKPLNGFYAAAYFRVSGSTVSEGRYPYIDNGHPIPLVFHGTTSGYSGGLMLGSQWHLKKNLLIDWWILGISWGSYKINVDADADLSTVTEESKETLRRTLEGLSLQGNKTKVDVSNSGVKIENTLSLPGFRTGLCIGYCF